MDSEWMARRIHEELMDQSIAMGQAHESARLTFSYAALEIADGFVLVGYHVSRTPGGNHMITYTIGADSFLEIEKFMVALEGLMPSLKTWLLNGRPYRQHWPR